jgi:hypothetical protein
MDRLYSTHGTEEDGLQGFGGKHRRKLIVRKTYIHVDGRIIFKWILEK